MWETHFSHILLEAIDAKLLANRSNVGMNCNFRLQERMPRQGSQAQRFQSDLELDVLVTVTIDDAVLESVLVDVLVDMLEVDVLEEWDVELLDLQLPGNALGLIINLEVQLKGSHN